MAGRILYRALVAIERNRGSWLTVAITGLAIAGYITWSVYRSMLPISTAEASGGASDCADITIQAFATGKPAAAHAAYGCLDRTVTDRTSEATFLQEASRASTGSVGSVLRIGEHRSQDGGKIVFYTLDTRGQSVGYIIYLSPRGRVLKVE